MFLKRPQGISIDPSDGLLGNQHQPITCNKLSGTSHQQEPHRDIYQLTYSYGFSQIHKLFQTSNHQMIFIQNCTYYPMFQWVKHQNSGCPSQYAVELETYSLTTTNIRVFNAMPLRNVVVILKCGITGPQWAKYWKDNCTQINPVHNKSEDSLEVLILIWYW